MFWEIWNSTHTKKKLDCQLTPYARINSKWLKNLHIIHNSIKVLGETIGSKISDIPPRSIFTNTSFRAREIKERINKFVFCMSLFKRHVI